jgi:magnesium transporter
MPADEAADIIQNLSDHKRMQVFRRLGVRKAKMLHRLTRYKEDVAGGLMNTDFMAVQKDMTVHEAIKKVRLNSEQHASIYHVFVVDAENHLEGIISIRTLLLAEKHEKISELMSRVYHTVKVTTSGEDVARIMTKYNLLSIAVIDRNKVVRGIITVDDILRFLIPDA